MAGEIGYKKDVYGGNIISWRPALCEQPGVPVGSLCCTCSDAGSHCLERLMGTRKGHRWNKQMPIHIHLQENIHGEEKVGEVLNRKEE